MDELHRSNRRKCSEVMVAVSGTVELFVLRSGDCWTVMRDGTLRGTFDYKIDAEEAAIRLAKEAQAKGRPSGVVSPDHGSRMHRIWPN